MNKWNENKNNNNKKQKQPIHCSFPSLQRFIFDNIFILMTLDYKQNN